MKNILKGNIHKRKIKEEFVLTHSNVHLKASIFQDL